MKAVYTLMLTPLLTLAFVASAHNSKVLIDDSSWQIEQTRSNPRYRAERLSFFSRACIDTPQNCAQLCFQELAATFPGGRTRVNLGAFNRAQALCLRYGMAAAIELAEESINTAFFSRACIDTPQNCARLCFQELATAFPEGKTRANLGAFNRAQALCLRYDMAELWR